MLLSEGLILVLQAVCFGKACYRGLYWKGLYLLGAFLLTLAIVKGLKS